MPAVFGSDEGPSSPWHRQEYLCHLLQRRFGELNAAAKAAGLVSAVDNSRQHPDAARDQHLYAQAGPDREADHEAERREQAVQPLPPVLVEKIVNESRRVDTHEGDECAEIQQLGAKLVIDSESANQNQQTGK